MEDKYFNYIEDYEKGYGSEKQWGEDDEEEEGLSQNKQRKLILNIPNEKIISKGKFLYLYFLIRSIFIKSNNPEKEKKRMNDKLQNTTDYINKTYLFPKQNFISLNDLRDMQVEFFKQKVEETKKKQKEEQQKNQKKAQDQILDIPDEQESDDEEFLSILNNNKNDSNSEPKFINIKVDEYSYDNFKNILAFIEAENSAYAPDILESILIQIFSLIPKIPSNYTINKYAFDNCTKLKAQINLVYHCFISTMISLMQTRTDEIREFFSVFGITSNADDTFNRDRNLIRKNELDQKEKAPKTLKSILKMISVKKMQILLNKRKEMFEPGNNMNIKHFKQCRENIYLGLKDIYGIREDMKYNDEEKRRITNVMACFDFLNNCDDTMIRYFHGRRIFSQQGNLTKIDFVKDFFCKVFIYYQFKNADVMKYNVQIDYDFTLACIEPRNSMIATSTLKLENNIDSAILMQNNFREIGLYELGKAIVLNDNIKQINLYQHLIRSYYLYYVLLGMRHFKNYSVQMLNLTLNQLKEDVDEPLSLLMEKLPNLRVLNLTGNELRNGLKRFFLTILNGYKNNTCNLEHLNLSRTYLEDSCLIYLANVVKSPYCKLKVLCLNEINMSFFGGQKVLKDLKYNKSLEELYLYRCYLGNNDFKHIGRLISQSSINWIYLYKNKFSDFETVIRIIAKAQIIDSNNDRNQLLSNLDLSNNDSWYKNSEQLKLLQEFLAKTGLTMLDISHMLKESNPDKCSPNDKKKYLETFDSFNENVKNLMLEKDGNDNNNFSEFDGELDMGSDKDDLIDDEETLEEKMLNRKLKKNIII